jgi:hypothetical protein
LICFGAEYQRILIELPDRVTGNAFTWENADENPLYPQSVTKTTDLGITLCKKITK